MMTLAKEKFVGEQRDSVVTITFTTSCPKKANVGDSYFNVSSDPKGSAYFMCPPRLSFENFRENPEHCTRSPQVGVLIQSQILILAYLEKTVPLLYMTNGGILKSSTSTVLTTFARGFQAGHGTEFCKL